MAASLEALRKEQQKSRGELGERGRKLQQARQELGKIRAERDAQLAAFELAVCPGECEDLNGDGICDDECIDANGNGLCENECYDDNFVWQCECVDTNGDGIADFVATGDGHGPLGVPGAVRAYSGRSGAMLWSVHQPSGGSFGMTLDALGDLDGDGVNDVIVGERFANSSTGRAWLFSGASGAVIDVMDGIAPDDTYRKVSGSIPKNVAAANLRSDTPVRPAP